MREQVFICKDIIQDVRTPNGRIFKAEAIKSLSNSMQKLIDSDRLFLSMINTGTEIDLDEVGGYVKDFSYSDKGFEFTINCINTMKKFEGLYVCKNVHLCIVGDLSSDLEVTDPECVYLYLVKE